MEPITPAKPKASKPRAPKPKAQPAKSKLKTPAAMSTFVSCQIEVLRVGLEDMILRLEVWSRDSNSRGGRTRLQLIRSCTLLLPRCPISRQRDKRFLWGFQGIMTRQRIGNSKKFTRNKQEMLAEILRNYNKREDRSFQRIYMRRKEWTWLILS